MLVELLNGFLLVTALLCSINYYFVRGLREHRVDIYERIGQPSVFFFVRIYGVFEKFPAFLIRRQHRSALVGDRGLCVAAEILLWLYMIQLALLFAVFVVAVGQRFTKST